MDRQTDIVNTFQSLLESLNESRKKLCSGKLNKRKKCFSFVAEILNAKSYSVFRLVLKVTRLQQMK